MRPEKLFIPFLILWLGCLNLNADQLYTWTDQKGVMHISRTPPPPTGELEEVIEYTPQTEEEIRKIRQQQDIRRTERAKESSVQFARKARKIADDADKTAKEAKKRADEADQRAREFKNKVGNDTDRIKRNRSKIRKLESEALKAKDIARQAMEVAREAEAQAKGAEKRAAEIMAPEDSSEGQLTDTEK